MADQCKQEHRIDRLEADIQELKEAGRKYSSDITELREGQAESRLFQKLIMEQLSEIKAMISFVSSEKENECPSSPNKEWFNLVKYVIGGTILVIVGWMASHTFGG